MAMSGWSLNNGHHENTTPGLSEELLQDEETLLSFMMDHSLKSPLKQSDPAKKTKSKHRTHTKKKTARNERKGAFEVKKTSKKGSSHPGLPLPKANDSQASPSLINNLNHEEDVMKYTPTDPNTLVQVPDSVGSLKTVVRFKLPKEGKGTQRPQNKAPEMLHGPPENERSKVILHPFDNETDGYFSDAEMSDSDTESGSGRGHHSQLDSGNEDNFRMSILAS
uniref:Uncharacterized protein n=1 Tax=Laticauda laticaudata TaxID=8630 RepID=A0A8C5RU93_LATLA